MTSGAIFDKLISISVGLLVALAIPATGAPVGIERVAGEGAGLELSVIEPCGNPKTPNGRLATSYLYDGANPVQELSGTTPTANLLTGFGADQYLRRTDSSGSRDLLSDGLGSTVALTDAMGAVQTSYSYEPFGNTTSSGAATGNSYQYTGRENDGSGLYYYGLVNERGLD